MMSDSVSRVLPLTCREGILCRVIVVRAMILYRIVLTMPNAMRAMCASMCLSLCVYVSMCLRDLCSVCC